MKLIRVLLPILLIFGLIIYAKYNYQLLPDKVSDAMPFLPLLIFLLSAILAVYFNRLVLLLLILICGTELYLFAYHEPESDVIFSIVSFILPLSVVITAFIRLQKVISVKAVSVYIFFAILFVSSLWLLRSQPEWMTELFAYKLLDAKYFEWSKVPQIAILLHFSCLILLVGVLSVRQDSISAAVTGNFIILMVLLYVRPVQPDLLILMTGGFLINLVSILKVSWSMAYLDDLTQIPARRAMTEKMSALVGIYSIAMIDIDFFKKFNDRFGHDTGDEVLRMVASKLKTVSGGGQVFRYGGEEFAIIFTNKDAKQVLPYIEEVRTTIESTRFVVKRGRNNTGGKNSGKTTPVTVSAGIADSVGFNNAYEVMKKADAGLYKAKKKGRNCTVIS